MSVQVAHPDGSLTLDNCISQVKPSVRLTVGIYVLSFFYYLRELLDPAGVTVKKRSIAELRINFSPVTTTWNDRHGLLSLSRSLKRLRIEVTSIENFRLARLVQLEQHLRRLCLRGTLDGAGADAKFELPPVPASLEQVDITCIQGEQLRDTEVVDLSSLEHAAGLRQLNVHLFSPHIQLRHGILPEGLVELSVAAGPDYILAQLPTTLRKLVLAGHHQPLPQLPEALEELEWAPRSRGVRTLPRPAPALPSALKKAHLTGPFTAPLEELPPLLVELHLDTYTHRLPSLLSTLHVLRCVNCGDLYSMSLPVGATAE
ncbi:hypothetical protein JKP88DRAFT_274304 [Tribonema minus]|uniref:Uncharacterized protein n=1 Tax=Tribonema minus TaxID=303371 RepID=A0A836C8W4_9STRA|nr:hypothetical protein JKP88DRAFT_274304 [Tribonema minus]